MIVTLIFAVFNVVLRSVFQGDWQSPHGCSDGDDPDLYNNAYIVYALKRAAEIVEVIGDEAVAPRTDGARFTAAAERIGAAVHFAPDRSTPGGGFGSVGPSSPLGRAGSHSPAI